MSTSLATEATPDALSSRDVRRMALELRRFLLRYEFGLREIETKVTILRDEFVHMHDYNPIEHISSRVKSVDSILAKMARRGLSPGLDAVRDNITDVAGIRITCSFATDAYRLFDLLTQQPDVTVRQVKDYIATPKPNGYRSLHAIVEVPVFLSTGTLEVPVEVQLRTIAMDFWATLEHKIHYKYDGQVPEGLGAELLEAADAAASLDARMERLHGELHSHHT
jgi:putative GTP pyrophosphokinase